MNLEPLSFALGILVVAALIGAAWMGRSWIGRMRASTRSQLEGTRRFLGRSADARYAREVARLAQKAHLAGGMARLTDILVEPRLLPGPPKGKVHSRIIMTPSHAKALIATLQENLSRFERNFGVVPPLAGPGAPPPGEFDL